MDDVVDGIAIQLGGGYVGLLSVPLFKDDGWLTNQYILPAMLGYTPQFIEFELF